MGFISARGAIAGGAQSELGVLHERKEEEEDEDQIRITLNREQVELV